MERFHFGEISPGEILPGRIFLLGDFAREISPEEIFLGKSPTKDKVDPCLRVINSIPREC